MFGLLAPVLLAPDGTFEVNGLDCQKLQRLYVYVWELVGLTGLFLGESEPLLVEFLVPGAALRWLGLLCVRK